jgi:hypothetical protein
MGENLCSLHLATRLFAALVSKSLSRRAGAIFSNSQKVVTFGMQKQILQLNLTKCLAQLQPKPSQSFGS